MRNPKQTTVFKRKRKGKGFCIITKKVELIERETLTLKRHRSSKHDNREESLDSE